MVSARTRRVALYCAILLTTRGTKSSSALAFQPTTTTLITTISTRQRRFDDRRGVARTALRQTDDDGDAAASSSSSAALSAQDAILRAALGVEPETESEKTTRVESAEREVRSASSSKTRNVVVAVLSFLAAVANYGYQYLNPVTDVQLLYEMSRASCPVTEIGTNGRPTVVDFWAPWCENCRRSAPTLAVIEKEYKDKVNFVVVNGDLKESWPLIETFRVDAIPHLALVDRDGNVETALIGPVPGDVLRADLDVLSGNNNDGDGERLREALPYKMFDPFQGKDESTRRVRFEER